MEGDRRLLWADLSIRIVKRDSSGIIRRVLDKCPSSVDDDLTHATRQIIYYARETRPAKPY